MSPKHPLRLGVYVVTSSGLVSGRDHRAVAAAAIEGGADAVQLRAPELDDRELLPVAAELAGLCAAAGVLFIVNDRVDVAIRSGADGVHLGQDDVIAGARAQLGAERVLGISVGSREQARAAESVEADYLGVTVWPTRTKPEAIPHEPRGLRTIVGATSLPVIGIGGIDASNATRVLEAGAAGVAVVSFVGASPDPVAATKELVETVRRWRAGER